MLIVPRDKENQEYYRASEIQATDLLSGAAGLDVLGRHEEVGRLHRMLDKARCCGRTDTRTDTRTGKGGHTGGLLREEAPRGREISASAVCICPLMVLCESAEWHGMSLPRGAAARLNASLVVPLLHYARQLLRSVRRRAGVTAARSVTRLPRCAEPPSETSGVAEDGLVRPRKREPGPSQRTTLLVHDPRRGVLSFDMSRWVLCALFGQQYGWRRSLCVARCSAAIVRSVPFFCSTMTPFRVFWRPAAAALVGLLGFFSSPT